MRNFPDLSTSIPTKTGYLMSDLSSRETGILNSIPEILKTL